MIPRDIVVTGEMLAEVRHHPREKVSRVEIIDSLTSRPTDDRPVETHFEGSSLYSPVPYLPQALAIRVGRALDIPPLLLMYLGRVADLATWIALVYVALRIIPAGGWAVIVLALTPMSLFISAMLSVDPVSHGLTTLWVALFVRMYRDLEPISKRDVRIATVTTVLLSLTKQPFFLLSLLVLLIPRDRFESGARRPAVLTVIGANLVAAIAWGWVSVDLFEPLRTDVVIDPSAQLSFMAHNPFAFLGAILASYFSLTGVDLFGGFIGNLGWLDAPIPLWAVGLHHALIVLALAGSAAGGRALARAGRYAVGGIALAFILAINAAMYTTWTPVGRAFVDGTQPRYFWPVVLLLVPICALGSARRFDVRDKALQVILTTGCFLTLAAGLATIYVRYYVA